MYLLINWLCFFILCSCSFCGLNNLHSRYSVNNRVRNSLLFVPLATLNTRFFIIQSSEASLHSHRRDEKASQQEAYHISRLLVEDSNNERLFPLPYFCTTRYCTAWQYHSRRITGLISSCISTGFTLVEGNKVKHKQ